MTAMAKSLKTLRRMYLCTHALSWAKQADVVLDMDDSVRERRFGMGEHWPGRVRTCVERDLKLRDHHYALIRNAEPDDGMFILESNLELVDLAKEHFGPRCVICRLENDLQKCCDALGPDYVKGLEDDRRRGEQARGGEVPDNELSAWGRSKAWAIDLTEQLRDQGFTFETNDVEFLAFGENWLGCGATFPIQMGRALGLAKPIERRFDWMNPDWSPMLLGAQLVDQNLPLADNIRLFIFKTADTGPTYGRYVAQFWEGMHGIMDRPHVVKVDFPPESVVECDVLGWPLCRARGLVEYPYRYFHGQMTMRAGVGAHTGLYSTVAMAYEKLSLEDFRAALLGGTVLSTNPSGTI
jgi:hypothetical protein